MRTTYILRVTQISDDEYNHDEHTEFYPYKTEDGARKAMKRWDERAKANGKDIDCAIYKDISHVEQQSLPF